MTAGCSENTDVALNEAASTITSDDALRHLSSLASDDMMGRDTDTPQIWDAARYIAAEFREIGLDPMDEDGDFIDEYTITIPETDCAEVQMVVESRGQQLVFDCGEDFAIEPMLEPPVLTSVAVSPLLEHGWFREHEGSIPDGSLVFVESVPTNTIAAGIDLGSKLMNIWEAGADAIAIIAPPGTTRETMRTMAASFSASPSLFGPPRLFVLQKTVETMFELTGAAAPDPSTLSSPYQAAATITFVMPVTTRTINAPNVVARLPGSQDGELKDVVLTAHFDHEPLGEPNALGDSILNGADDNASGTVGLMEVARAFAAMPKPPDRSVVFAAVSAEELGLLGSAHLAEFGPAPATSTAANLNMDMICRNGPDSLFVFGQTLSSLGDVFRTVLNAHPELGLAVREGLQQPEIDLIRFSDQASYLERGVPFLFFHSGFHPELHTPEDEVELADTDKLARSARLMFYLAYAVADDREDPVWTEAGQARTEGMQHTLLRH